MAVLRIPRRIKAPNTNTFDGLWAFINADDKNKEDYKITGSELEFTPRKTLAIHTKNGLEEYAFSPWSFMQFSEALKIPPRFLNDCPITGKGSMKDIIEMRMEGRKSAEFFVRTRRTKTADGAAGLIRAVLPGNYSPFDNRHLLKAVSSAIKETPGDFQIANTNANDPKSVERALHLRVVERETFDFEDLHIHDPHSMGFHARTSEVGASRLQLDAIVFRLVCSNGMMGWKDATVLKENFKGTNEFETTPRLQEAVLAAIRQREVVKELLTRVYGEPVKDPETQLLLMGKHMRVSGAMIERALDTFRLEGREKVTRFHLAQAYTQAAQALPIGERSHVEVVVGQALFGSSRRSSQAA